MIEITPARASWVARACTLAMVASATAIVSGCAETPTYHHADPERLPRIAGAEITATYDDPAVDTKYDHNYMRWIAVTGSSQLTLRRLVDAELALTARMKWTPVRPLFAGVKSFRSPDGKLVAHFVTARTESGQRRSPIYPPPQLLPAILREERAHRPTLVALLVPQPSPNPK